MLHIEPGRRTRGTTHVVKDDGWCYRGGCQAEDEIEPNDADVAAFKESNHKRNNVNIYIYADHIEQKG